MNGIVLEMKKALAQRTLPLCLCVLVALSVSAPAFAQSQDIVNRVKRLENEVQTLNRAVYKGEQPPVQLGVPAPEDSMLLDRIQQLETELRNLTGKVEQQSYDSQQIQMRLDALEQDARMRLDTVEGQLRQIGQQPAAAATQGHAPPQPSVAPPADGAAFPVTVPEEAAPSAQAPAAASGGTDAASLYETGFGYIKAAEYGAAEKTFTAFLREYPEHALAPNALYWLGETFYVRKQYDKAARSFAEAFQKYPDGPKGADNLLKLGMSLAGAGKKDDACVALGELKRKYPSGPAPVMAKGESEKAALGCS